MARVTDLNLEMLRTISKLKKDPISDRIWAKTLCNSHTNAQQQTFPLDQFAFSGTSRDENVTAFTGTSGESGKGKTLSYRYRTVCLQAFLIQPKHFPEISKWYENCLGKYPEHPKMVAF